MLAHWPNVSLAIRANRGFAVPTFYIYCEQPDATYSIGVIPSARLENIANPLLVAASYRRDLTSEMIVRLSGELTYETGSWDRVRRVVYKAEAMKQGANTRFVLTSRPDLPEKIYNWYVQR